MSYYRLYLLNDSGSIARMMEIECVGDEAALDLAAKHPHRGGWELWNRDRLVRRHEPVAAPAAQHAPELRA